VGMMEYHPKAETFHEHSSLAIDYTAILTKVMKLLW